METTNWDFLDETIVFSNGPCVRSKFPGESRVGYNNERCLKWDRGIKVSFMKQLERGGGSR